MGANVADFGVRQDGFRLLRISGTEAEIADTVIRLKSLKIEIQEPFDIDKAHMSHSALVRAKLPEEPEEPEEEPEVEVEPEVEPEVEDD